MKTLAAIALILASNVLPAQRGPLINELQASNHGTVTDPTGATPDWIEIFNPSGITIDLVGMRLAIAGRQHVIDEPLKVPPQSHRILWLDGAPKKGVDHIGFKLPREGGSLLLIAADGFTILDVFTWKDLRRNESLGRYPDGAKTWRYFPLPTPGAANSTSPGLLERVPDIVASHPAGSFSAPFQLELSAKDAAIFYTTDGSTPARENGIRYEGPLSVDGDLAIRACAFSEDGIKGREFSPAFLMGDDTLAFSLTIPEQDLYDEITGIHCDGARANHTRSGRAWERQVIFQHGERAIPAGLRIHGSGSRALAKRSFKLFARNRYSSPKDAFTFIDGSIFNEGILRADASPGAFLRNMLMEVIASRPDVHLEVQPSMPAPLYINGAYHGLYRWMPPKDAQWLRHVAQVEAVDVLDGPANTAISGKDLHYRRGQELLLNGAPADSIGAYFDLESLMDLACLDLFTGRADHDLNVRCYRPRQEGGRWRWVLYDMDLWAPAGDHSISRMCSALSPETPYVPQLLDNPELQEMLLARITALTAGLLAPEFTRQIIDSLHAAHLVALERDHDHWRNELRRPTPQEAHAELSGYLEQRVPILLRHLADRTHRTLHKLTVDVPQASLALVTINDLPLAAGGQELLLFSGTEMKIAITPAKGVEFIGWKGVGDSCPEIIVSPGKIRHLRPRLTTTGASGGNGL